MIKRNKTIAKIMILTVCASMLTCTGAFATDIDTNIYNATTSSQVQINTSDFSTNEDDNIEYTNEDYFSFSPKTGTITGYKGKDTTVVIPKEIHGVKVTSIARSAFNNNYNIKEVIIPDTVETIGHSAFLGCSHLKKVVLSKNLTTLGDGAFEYCHDLESINIPEGITTIQSSTFSNCWNLKDVTLPEGLTTIKMWAFNKCSHLKDLTLPSTIKDINLFAFENSNAVLHAPSEEVKNSIGYLFGATVIVDSKNDQSSDTYEDIKYNDESDFVFSVSSGAITKYIGTSDTIIIPKTIRGVKVTSIANYAFKNNRNIKEVIIPDTVETIGQFAFSGCHSLKKVVLSKNLTTLGSGAFEYCQALESINIPEGITTIQDSTFIHCQNLKDVTLPEGLTTIKMWAFSQCDKLKNLTLPSTIKDVNYFAFEYSSVVLHVPNEAVKNSLPSCLKKSAVID